MYPTSIISVTFTDLIEQPKLFKSILTSLISICDIELQKGEPESGRAKRKPRKTRTENKDSLTEEDSIL